MTSNSKQNRQKNRTLKDEKLVPPTKKKNRIQTSANLY